MIRRLLNLCGLMLLYASSATVIAGSPSTNPGGEAHIAHLVVDGAIGPATTKYLNTAMAGARADGARAVVIQINTPGGLDAATRDIIQMILSSPVPIITYVHPSGARAASAGTYVLYASHIAAMTPATTLGAATPVSMGGGGSDHRPIPSPRSPGANQQSEDADADEDNSTPNSGTAMERKVVNDAVAFIRGLAARHNRNAEWAEQAVREAASLTAAEALDKNVIDIIAKDLNDLINNADGRTVQMQSGPVTLSLANLPVVKYEASWHHRLLSIITNPQVAYILLLIGIYGLIFEGYSPGAMVPGVIGVISLLLAFYALQVLPISYAGLALIIVGALLIAAEAFVPSFGVLGIGGVIALVIGSTILIDTEVPGMMVSRELIAAIGAVTSLIVLAILIFAGRSLRIPRLTISKEMVGRTATVVHSDLDRYQVRIHGELWQAESSLPLLAGQKVRVTEQHGLTLVVEPIEAKEVTS